MGLIAVTAGGLITGYSNQFGALTSVAKGILCIPQLLSPSGLKNLTAGIMGALSAVAGEVIAGLLGFVGTVVSRTIENITGIISSQIAAINAFIEDISATITLIKSIIGSLDDIAKNTMKFLLDGQNCQFAAAELGKCIVGGILEEITNKAARDLSIGSLDYHKKVQDITTKLIEPERIIGKFNKKAQMFANKAAIQQRI
jgi:phage-related protein